MNTPPEDIQNTIYKYKHGIELKKVMTDSTGDVYVYGARPKCHGNCEDEMLLGLDTLSQIQRYP